MCFINSRVGIAKMEPYSNSSGIRVPHSYSMARTERMYNKLFVSELLLAVAQVSEANI